MPTLPSKGLRGNPRSTDRHRHNGACPSRPRCVCMAWSAGMLYVVTQRIRSTRVSAYTCCGGRGFPCKQYVQLPSCSRWTVFGDEQAEQCPEQCTSRLGAIRLKATCRWGGRTTRIWRRATDPPLQWSRAATRTSIDAKWAWSVLSAGFAALADPLFSTVLLPHQPSGPFTDTTFHFKRELA